MTDAVNRETVDADESTIGERSLPPIDVRRWQGEWVFDETGEVVGRIADVLVDAETKPRWLVLSFGAFLHEDRIIPVFDIRRGTHGFILSYAKDLVHRAPVVSVESMSDDEERRLYSYWCSAQSTEMPRACTLLSRAA
ncbi:MAG: PRC-barrel domain-containing protein [Thermoleophilia bacterium]